MAGARSRAWTNSSSCSDLAASCASMRFWTVMSDVALEMPRLRLRRGALVESGRFRDPFATVFLRRLRFWASVGSTLGDRPDLLLCEPLARDFAVACASPRLAT